MKGISGLMAVLKAGLLLFLIDNLLFASDLIEPTRTLSRPAENAGELSLFSEPFDLDVTIDGTQIGKTPLIGLKVQPGIHAVRVKDNEIEIYVEPGKSAKLSWFKGAFIEIPAEVKADRRQLSETTKETHQITTSAQSDEKKEKPDPLYWPLNPGGPIY
jgi:hypothetical protein